MIYTLQSEILTVEIEDLWGTACLYPHQRWHRISLSG